MKKLFCIFIIIPVFSFAQKDTTFSKNGNITSINDEGINMLVSEYENILKSRNGITGWRVQLGFKEKKEDIDKIKINFMLLYPDIVTYTSYDAPYYRLRVGNCKTKLEAIRIKQLISKNFPDSYHVPEIINISK